MTAKPEMTGERWERVSELVDEVLRLDLQIGAPEWMTAEAWRERTKR